MHAPVLQVENLFCERDDRILFAGLSFDVSSGDIVQLEGPNGAGKTTLLRILSGLLRSYEGNVSWEGKDIHDYRAEYAENTLVLGHKSAVKTSLTPIENLRFLIGLHRPFDEVKAFEALAKVGLAGYEHVLCRNLSAGQHRRVSLARLYLSDAKVWLLDEIFTAIDKAGVAQFEALLGQKAQEGVAIVLTTHHQLAIDKVRKVTLGQQVTPAADAGGMAHV